MKKALLTAAGFGAYLLYALLVQGGFNSAHAITYTYKQFSSGTTGAVSITSETATAVPDKHLQRRMETCYVNMSSSETVYFDFDGVDTVNDGWPLSPGVTGEPGDKLCIQTNPLAPWVTSYFQAPVDSTDASLRYLDMGHYGGYE